MQTPPQIVFEGMDSSEFIEQRILEELAKLEQFYDRIISARVVVYLPHKRHAKGNLFGVKVFLSLPGDHDVVVDRRPARHHAHEDMNVAIRDSFGAARRQLQDAVRKMQGKTKRHGGGA